DLSSFQLDGTTLTLRPARTTRTDPSALTPIDDTPSVICSIFSVLKSHASRRPVGPSLSESAPRTGNDRTNARLFAPRTGPYRPDGIGNATTRSSMPSRSISTGSGDGLLSSASSSSFFFGPLSLGGTGGGEPGARSGRWAGSKGDGMSPRSVTRWGRGPVGNT